MGLLEALGEMVHGARDAGASFLVKRAVGHWLEPYGRMLSLSIDSKNARIRVELLPKGEKEPIAIDIEEYQLTTVAGAEFIVIKKATASREWIDALVKDFLIGRTIPLPEKYGHVIRSML